MSTLIDIVSPVEPVVSPVVQPGMTIALIFLVLVCALLLIRYRRRLLCYACLYAIEISRQSPREKLLKLYRLISSCFDNRFIQHQDSSKQSSWERYFQALNVARFSAKVVSDEDWQALLRESRYWARQI